MFQFQSLSDFMSMGGHGPYVWASYAVTLLLMLYLVFSPLLRSRRELESIKNQDVISRRRSTLKEGASR